MDLKKYIADIPDFPEEGIIFRDVTPLLADKDAYHESIRLLTEFAKDKNVDVVVVTAIDNNNTLINELQSKCSFNIVSIGDVLKEAWKGDI